MDQDVPYGYLKEGKERVPGSRHGRILDVFGRKRRQSFLIGQTWGGVGAIKGISKSFGPKQLAACSHLRWY